MTNKFKCLYCNKEKETKRNNQKFCNFVCSNNYQKENNIGYYNKDVQKLGGHNSMINHKKNKTFCYDKKLMKKIQKKLKVKKIGPFYNKKLRHKASVAGGKKSQTTLRKNKLSIFYDIDMKRKMMIEKVWNNKDLQARNGRKHSKFMRIYTQKQLILTGKIRTGKNEKQILDEIELSIRNKIIRQYTVIGYFIDGYIKELNLAIEIDELYHNNIVKKDIIRENNIKQELNCDFVRIGDNL